MQPQSTPAERGRALLALALLVPVPSLAVLCSLVWEPMRGDLSGQIIYGAAKVWILALPVAWRVFVERQSISFSPMRHGGMGAGVLTGIVIAAGIFAGYWLIGQRLIDPQMLEDVAEENNLTSLPVYLALVLYLTLINSLLEEYVWRWFVYRQCERVMPAFGGWLAVIVSGLFFTLHHIIALQVQFGWAVTLVGSAGIFVGGVTWSWLYRRYRSVWPGYVSHVFADTAVFIIGWLLLFTM